VVNAALDPAQGGGFLVKTLLLASKAHGFTITPNHILGPNLYRFKSAAIPGIVWLDEPAK
jgi:hypothetical protein